MDKIIVIGASGHAKVIIDIVEKQGDFEIFGLIDSFKNIGDKVFDYSIIGNEKDIPNIIKDNNIIGGVIAIGDNFTRMQLYNKIIAIYNDFQFVSAIHPNAVIGKNVTIGNGSVIMAGVVINSDSKIGIQTIINTKSSIDHEAKIGNFSSIAPGVTIGGDVTIGKCSAVSLGAKIIEGIHIGNNTVIGAAALVLKSFGNNQVVFGVPATSRRQRENSDKYLGHIESINTDKTSNFVFKTIKTAEDIENYNSILEKFKGFNTFYSLEYCNHNTQNPLSYLLFSKDDKPHILMPIILKNIKSELFDSGTLYFDAATPYGFSGPLFNSTVKDQDIKLFWQHVDNWYKKNNVVTEFIRFSLTFNYKYYTGNIIPTLNNVKGRLTDFDSIWDNFKQKVRNNYRKADSNGLKSEIYSNNISLNIINSFYDIYIKTMERNNATENYFYQKEYFFNLIKNNQNKIVIVLIFLDNKPISSELIIVNEKTLHSYLGGTLSEYFDLRPNDFLKIEVIKWGLKNGMKYYALGGGRKDGDGLYQYKKSFFPKDDDVMFFTGRKVVNPEIYKELIKNCSLNISQIETLVKNSSIYFPLYKEHEPGAQNVEIS
ncbi:NeuD/PglB/VioB family sugar acetyltransferase [Mariniflexile sp.]|uniref:NeuD/PglB/VioB family sugar acetyltransferase n=1 Tax=Mariniflexile sp. TaxID=1979402 RepID=UPI004048B783